ncbi:hypothetical protein GGR50DRAFT_695441 [Xylaria sp. CBS 124048]|nr:hypothetical protein GGR50DRAFT_695441 [Xylaria sp. CBS 124048]
MKDGVFFLTICPGFVATGQFDGREPTPKQQASLADMLANFQNFSPRFKGPAAPAESIRNMLSVMKNSCIEKGKGGQSLSHLGNKTWF